MDTKRVYFSDEVQFDHGNDKVRTETVEEGDEEETALDAANAVEEENACDGGTAEDEGDDQGHRAETFTRMNLRPPTLPGPVTHYRDGKAMGSSSTPQSPVRKKITTLQDRRVNTILLEAMQLIDFSKDELMVLEKSVKKLREAIHGFTILVDKQVNIIGVENLEDRGRVKADIQDLAENLRTSYEVLDSTCSRMRQTLVYGRHQVHVHKKRLGLKGSLSIADVQGTEPPTSPHRRPGSGSPKRIQTLGSPSIKDIAITYAPAPGRIPFSSILEPQQSHADSQQNERWLLVPPEFFSSVLKSVGLLEKEFLDTKDLMRFLTEMLTFSIARSRRLTFMGKAFHRRLIPSYVKELTQVIIDELQLATASSPPGSPTGAASSPTKKIALPQLTLYDFLCEPPYRLDTLLVSMFVADANDYTGERSAVTPPMDQLPANPFKDHVSANGGVLHGGKVVETLLVNRPEPELLETAEQTLAMAKLLHDLASAETEAKYGNRISVRSENTRSSAFSKAYIATSKELLTREMGVK